MEEDKLFINEKLYGFDGVIGRHAYFVNIVIICSISALVMLPYTTYLYTHIGSFTDFFNLQKTFINAPGILKCWVLFGVGAVCTLSVSNIFRRLNDIFGEVKIGTNSALSAISVLNSCSFMLPFPLYFLFAFLAFVLAMFLFFTKGKITNALPYDYKKEFNWGAFFGTWIWGLFNRSYVPLWILLLWLTPWCFYFQLYCGLKGNEWAFKNKNCTDLNEFNKSQEKQTLIFTILSLLVFPILYILFFAAVIMAVIFFVVGFDSNAKNLTPEQHKEKSAQIESKLEKFMDFMLSVYFEKYEFDDNENKFYVENSVWSSADFKEKKDMLDLAASKSSEYREKEHSTSNSKGHKHFSKYTELPRTKIYSLESGKLLGEFVDDENVINEGSFKDALMAAFKAYRFYNP